MNSRARILVLATLAVPLRADATDYDYGSSADLAITPYTSADQITLNGTTVTASAPVSVPAFLVRLFGPAMFSLANDLTLTGVISGTSNSPLTKSGTATFLLAGDSPNYTGSLTLNAGTLRLGSASAVGAMTPTHGVGTVNLNANSTLDLNGFTLPHVIHYNGGALINDNTLTPVNLPGTGSVGGTYIMGGAGDLTFNNPFISSGSFTKIGPGTVTLTSPINTGNYYGNFNVNGGTLRLAAAGAYGNTYGNVYLNAAGTLDLNGISPVQKTYTFNGGTLANNNVASPLTLDSSNFYANGSTSATASIGFGGAGDLTVNAYLSSYSAPLIKTGAGTLTLVQSVYTQGVQVQGGTLRITSSTTLPQNGSTTTVLPGGSLDLNGLAPPNANISLAGGALVNNNTTTPVTVFTSPYLSLPGPNLSFGGAGAMTLNVSPSTTQSLTKVGTGTLTLNSGNSHTGGTFLLAGTTLVSGDFPLGAFGSPLTITDGTLRNTFAFNISRPVTLAGSLGGFDTPNALTITRAVTGTGALNKLGSSTLTLTSTLTVGPLAIQSGSLILNGSSPSTVVTSLAVSPGASLQMNRPRLFIDTATADPLPLDSVRSLLLAGFNAGDWLGTGGVTASSLSADTSHTRALAYADLVLLPTSYRQLAGVDIVDVSSILIRPTYYGDINCDGKLDLDDYCLLDRSIAMSPANAHWTDGDFNYDATVDQSDFLLLDTAYLATHPAPPSPTFFADRETRFGADYVSSLLTSIPEPTPCSILCLLSSLSLLLHRRRAR